MRSFSHWTLRYIVNRLMTIYYEKASPDHPWLTCQANRILDSMLKPSDAGLEFGSGRSTMWFAKRLRCLTSVEHNPEWAAKVRRQLDEKGCINVDYRFIPQDVPDEQGGDSAYVRVIDEFAAESLDFCLVDAAYRDFCALKVIDKLKPGGLLVIDNVNRYLPSDTHSPYSRSLADGPAGVVWKEVGQILADWRSIWTSSGVTDTAIYIKPCKSRD